MTIALIGGMDRLERHYIDEAKNLGFTLKVFTKSKSSISERIKQVEAIVVFTNKVSHKTRQEALSIAKTKNIPVLMHHSCGICTLRDCLNCLKNQNNLSVKS